MNILGWRGMRRYVFPHFILAGEIADVDYEQTVEWLWNHHFAAVAGDAIAFEAWPPKAPYRISPSLFSLSS